MATLLPLPSTLGLGEYSLKVRVTDDVGQYADEAIIPIRIIDSSQVAIDRARALADTRQLACRFEVLDLLADNGPAALRAHGEPYDQAFDWELLCHIFPEHRERPDSVREPGGWEAFHAQKSRI